MIKEKIEIRDLDKDQLAALAQEILKAQEKAKRLLSAKLKKADKERQKSFNDKVKKKAETQKQKQAEKEKVKKEELKNLTNSDIGQFIRLCKETSKESKEITITVPCLFDFKNVCHAIMPKHTTWSNRGKHKLTAPEALGDYVEFLPEDFILLLTEKDQKIKMILNQREELIKKYGATKLNSLINKVYSKIKI